MFVNPETGVPLYGETVDELERSTETDDVVIDKRQSTFADLAGLLWFLSTLQSFFSNR